MIAAPGRACDLPTRSADRIFGANMTAARLRVVGYGEPEEAALLARDPVCGRDVSITQAAASSDWAGTTYYFCSLECQLDFDRQPDRYVPSMDGEA